MVLKSSKKFMPTYILIALNVMVYIYTSLVGGNFLETNNNVILLYGQVNYFVLHFNWYWQLFTAMFVHISIMHLLGNMLFLLIFGLRAEDLFSIQEYLLVYFLSGLVGNCLTLLLSFIGIDMISAGASGAIFGLFGACIIYMKRAVSQSIISALLYAFFLLFISSGPEVNNLAHIGGLAVGLLIGYGLATTRRFKTTYKYNYSYKV
jgi:rhomboid protease GluP